MFYASNPLDRADQIRKQPGRLGELLTHTESRVIPFDGDKAATECRKGKPDQRSWFSLPAHQLAMDPDSAIFLGIYNQQALFTIDNTQCEPRITCPEHVEFMDLRACGPILSQDDGTILAYAKAMLHWQSITRYCQKCGSPTTSAQGGHVKRCSNSTCGYDSFPRTDPAVIMLISDGGSGDDERCLLGRHPAWPDGVYSTLAGFVEPGESLEHAVRREVLEEANVQVGDVQYVASQPWPFPQSIMLGFQGVATSSAITLDPTELADAQWFTRRQLNEFGTWGDAGAKWQMPRKDSIARHLIDTWRYKHSPVGTNLL